MQTPLLRKPIFQARGNFGSPGIDMGGCVLYLPLCREDQAGSPFNSSSVYGIPTHVCTVVGATWGITGRTFNGTNDLINCGSPAALDNIAPVTYAAWIYPTASTLYHRIFCKININGDTSGTVIAISSDDALYWACDFVTAMQIRASNNSVITLNAWQMVTLTWDGSITAANVHMYINLVEPSYQTTQNGAGARISDAAYDQIIGNTPGEIRGFAGKIGDCLIFNRVLTAAEILHIYVTTKWRYI